MYPEITRRAGFAAKVETTSGTDAVPTVAADAIRLLGVGEVETGYLAPNTRDDMLTGGLGVLAPVAPGARYHRFPIRFVPIGAGVAYSASVLPECAPIMRAAGFSQAVDTTPSAEKVTYSLSDDPATTLTAQLEVSGKKYKTLFTIVESLRLALTAAGFPIVDAVLVGIAVDPAEIALEAHTYDNVDLPIWKGTGAFDVSTYSPIVRSANLNMNIRSASRLNANATDGHAGYRITGRRTVIDFLAEVVALSTWDPNTDRKNATQRTLDARIGSTQYRRLKIEADHIVYEDLRDVEENELRMYNAQLVAATPTSGVELNWIFD